MKEALKLALEALEKLWNIIDDIDTYGDMAKGDEKLYRALVERRQRTRFEETGISTDGYELTGGVITAIKAALAQPEQEPVAWGVFEGNLHDMFFTEAEAVEMAQLKGTHAEVKPLYTAPQRPWVGLTLHEIESFEKGSLNRQALCCAIEAKLKEKNV